MLATFKKRWKLFGESIEKAEPGIYSDKTKLWFYIKFLFLRATKGVYMIDFIQYKFYERNRFGRKRFVEYQSLHWIMEKCNDVKSDELFDSKKLFNERFEKFLGRPWLSIKDSTYEEFVAFLKENDEIFVKPEVGSFGDGIEILRYQENHDYHDKYEKLVRSESIAEGLVKQAKEFSEFNESSLNTMRIVTLIDKNGQSNIMVALVRLGRKGKVADNFHHYGIAAKIDIETGVVNTTGVDREFARYTVHPDSNKVIPGFKIPKWDEIKARVIELSKQVPQTRYVGWDISLDENYNIICIEGNRGADPDVTQVTDQVGKYFDYKNRI